MNFPPDTRVVRETREGRVGLYYNGVVRGAQGQETHIFTLDGNDACLGRSIGYYQVSPQFLKMLHQAIGELLALEVKTAAAQVVEVRIVHETAPASARVDEPARDPERAELEEIKAGMRKDRAR